MPDHSPRRAACLEALARLQPAWTHEARSHLGNVSLQVDLLVEHLARSREPDAALAETLAKPLERARHGIAKLEELLGRPARWARAPEPGVPGLDLAAALAELGALVEPGARARRVAWSWAVPPGPVRVAGDWTAVREATAIAVVEAVFAAAAGARIEARLDENAGRARLRLDGASAPRDAAWPALVRETFEASGGAMEAGAGVIDLSLPLAAVPEAR